MSDFHKLGLCPALNAAIDQAGFTEPTPIQTQAIPLALAGHDVMGLAQTGTGKTLAFGLPLLNELLAMDGKPAPKSAAALILTPTRELATQIAENLQGLVRETRLKIGLVVGGQSIHRQVKMVGRGQHVVVATPGRLIDLMDRRAIELGWTQSLVLDEADQMLDMGFIHALRRIAPELGTPRRTMMFSATMPKKMEELSRAFLTDPKRVQVAPLGQAADKIDQSVHFMEKPAKPAKLRELLAQDRDARTLVFARTKYGAEKMMRKLVQDGFDAEAVHGDRNQNQRDRAIRAFRAGHVKVLVATDVAARGIDIPDVSYVVNYDLPDAPENYIHRIGRTARAGKEGKAIAFCAPEEAEKLRDIQKLMKLEIPVASGEAPAMPAPSAAKPARKRPAARNRRRRPRHQKAA